VNTAITAYNPYLACWFFKFISPDVKSMEGAIASHGFGHGTQTFTGYVVTADKQPVKQNMRYFNLLKMSLLTRNLSTD